MLGLHSSTYLGKKDEEGFVGGEGDGHVVSNEYMYSLLLASKASGSAKWTTFVGGPSHSGLISRCV